MENYEASKQYFEDTVNSVKDNALETIHQLLQLHITNCYNSSCCTTEDIREYEKSLLEKCVDENDNVYLGNPASYEPPFIINNI